MERKWLNVELNDENAKSFRMFLWALDIRYETSGCYNLVHFECFMNDREKEAADKFLRVLL